MVLLGAPTTGSGRCATCTSLTSLYIHVYSHLMDLIQHAAQLLADTENSLRDLISEGLEQQSYGEVAQIAALAEKLSGLRNAVSSQVAVQQNNINGSRLPEPIQTEYRGESQPSIVPAEPPAIKARSRHTNYPVFEKDGDRLVKVGWSARERRAYEHRAPKVVVSKVCDSLGRRSAKGRRFRMEEILPDLAGDTEAIPAYQAYLTLAWLRSEGVVERDGKDGYRVKNGSLSADRIEKLWDSVASR